MIESIKEFSNAITIILSTGAATIAWIKAHTAKKCISCNYKKRVEKEEIVSELKSMARRKLEEIDSIMKSHFLSIAMQYCAEENYLEYPPYKIFITCLDSAKRKMMEILVEDFYRNHLNKYTRSDIKERADYLFKHITDIFDLWYCPESPPCRKILFDETEKIDQHVRNILTSIYEYAKEKK